MPKLSGKRAFLEPSKQQGLMVLLGDSGTAELPLTAALAAEDGQVDDFAQAAGRPMRPRRLAVDELFASV